MRSIICKAIAFLLVFSSAHFTAAAQGGGAVPNVWSVRCETTVGSVDIKVHSEWAPIGARRFLDLVSAGYLDGTALFRAIPNFLVQFGLSKDEGQREEWRGKANLKDDPLRPEIPIKFGTMAFAGGGKDSRTTQVWISFTDSDPGLGTRPWETPFAQVVGKESLATLRRINTEYRDSVDQGQIWNQGYQYLTEKFPRLSYVKTCQIAGHDAVHARVNRSFLQLQSLEVPLTSVPALKPDKAVGDLTLPQAGASRS